ncbi:cephalosporin-C deacetylase [Motilibacter rhizosphaerae]|uniref:Cephalosporin-C deacetylase n=1 Tax=Motilibacter rhizosphaerae TaxID=598652 RepID=A0A4Q7NRP7_9ACTN|nr:acetylxylan esterase [Motilibacter rhizosphaerae]RZS89756.1 cephalosporin-C deacetylase [Motilibacter rhizosphaerae]
MAWYDLPLEQLRTHRTATQAPADLDAFWSRVLAATEAAARPTTLERWKPGVYGPTPVWDVEFSGGRGDRIRAWYLRPAGVAEDEPLPVVVTSIGYGGGRSVPADHLALPALGFASLVMDTRGQGARWAVGSTGDGPDLGPELSTVMSRGITDPEQYYYTRLYCDVARAVDVAARDLPGVDSARIGVTGGSQGGALSLAAAALRPGLVRAVAADVPFLCDISRAIRITDSNPYKEVGDFLAQHVDLVETAERTLAYVDNAVLAPRITAPVHMTVGLMDDICPPSTVFAAFNALEVEDRSIVVNQFGGHSPSHVHDELKLRFLRERLGLA